MGRLTLLWRDARYLLVCLPTALATLVFVPLLGVGVMSIGLGGLGFVLLPRMAAGLRRWTEWHRRRAGALLGVPVPAREMDLPQGVGAQWRRLIDDREVRRDLLWMFRHILIGLPAGLVALATVGGAASGLITTPLWWVFPADDPLQVLGMPVTGWASAIGLGGGQAVLLGALGWWTVPRLAGTHARGCLAALEPSSKERLAERVGELTESRAGVLDAHGAELRRIERDLHDGAQARLVAIAMRLGVAREALPEDAELVARLLKEAHEGTEAAMTELREVIRTMYPPVLADRGLQGAVAAVTAHAGVPVEVVQDDLGRVPAAVEAAAYFIVAETITNVARHSGATRAAVRLSRRGGLLVIEVSDDGRGGIDESRGTGVAGIRKRAAALDGVVRIDSPPGGPTLITVELPCGS
ncbi:sensor histidine kinase [Nonomuraea sp. NN258]|uniref:sensor histidine kinase n=1 Tax=Nonomuraea antri TaxID=2730852 RepID=UPI0015690751|nr:sensor histidine kinase [Nonomuraea antri]NRQ39397.1 sensor histidine kinase [Nonomuraea antri]